MKKLFVTVFALGAIATVTNAQTTKMAQSPKMEKAMASKGTKESRDAKYADAFKAANLSADEQSKAKAILDESHTSMKAVKANAAMSAAEKATKMKELSKDKNTKMKAALGAKYKAYKMAMRVENKEARGE